MGRDPRVGDGEGAEPPELGCWLGGLVWLDRDWEGDWVGDGLGVWEGELIGIGVACLPGVSEPAAPQEPSPCSCHKDLAHDQLQHCEQLLGNHRWGWGRGTGWGGGCWPGL